MAGPAQAVIPDGSAAAATVSYLPSEDSGTRWGKEEGREAGVETGVVFQTGRGRRRGGRGAAGSWRLPALLVFFHPVSSESLQEIKTCGARIFFRPTLLPTHHLHFISPLEAFVG